MNDKTLCIIFKQAEVYNVEKNGFLNYKFQCFSSLSLSRSSCGNCVRNKCYFFLFFGEYSIVSGWVDGLFLGEENDSSDFTSQPTITFVSIINIVCCFSIDWKENFPWYSSCTNERRKQIFNEQNVSGIDNVKVCERRNEQPSDRYESLVHLFENISLSLSLLKTKNEAKLFLLFYPYLR